MILMYKGTSIFYSVKGTGNPMILLHGFLESSSIWDFLGTELSTKRQVICIDLPGHGKSGVCSDVHTMELMADVVIFVLKHLKIKTAHFTGHSMGGYVSLSILENFPEMVKGIVLINSTPLEDTEERKIQRDRSVIMVEKNKNIFIKMSISSLIAPNNQERCKEELDKMIKEALQFPTEGIIAALKGMKVRTSTEKALTKFNKTKIMFSGIKDPLIPYSSANNIANSCNCLFYPLQNGHLGPIEDPTEILQKMYFVD